MTEIPEKQLEPETIQTQPESVDAVASGNVPGAQEQVASQETKPEAPAEKKETAVPEKTVNVRNSRDNVIYIGKKPTMSYVLAVITQFSDDVKEVLLKARGRSISHAVDVAEVVRNKFASGVKTEVEIGTEKVTDRDGRTLKVSTITIALKK